MARRSKRCTVALADVVLLGGGAAITSTWKDPDTISAAAPTVMELEYVPKSLKATRTTAGAGPGHLTITATKTGCTVTSSIAGDNGTIRIFGAVDENER